jgi:precorrin-6Y C5,15-methyltransferase (decarboxylating)
MSDAPWLTIVGLGEDGPDGLSAASLNALAAADTIIGPARHLALLPDVTGKRIEWPVPFADGLDILKGLKGTPTVALVSGDPFWFGAGSVIARQFAPGEWRALPNVSVFSQAAAHLGWPLETTLCTGLHAAPFARLRPHLVPDKRAIVTLRDGAAVGEFAAWLVTQGFGNSTLHVLEALGGANARNRTTTADAYALGDVAHPVAVALKIAGQGVAIPCSSGKPDALFQNDGQITKRPIRALTLSALAPRPGETLWDLGAGSGSIAIEWLMSDPSTQAVAVEARADRAAQIRENADALGQDRLQIITGQTLDHLTDLPRPDAIFIGGGLSTDLLDALWATCPQGTRIVANAVTLETEALVVAAHARLGGDLLRIALSKPADIGKFRAWSAAYPLVQWSITR